MNRSIRQVLVPPQPQVSGPGTVHPEAVSYYFLFDYLRFVLAAGVLAFHADAQGVLPKYLGDLCVKVFFALSGFLIGGILLRTRPKDLPRFYFNRVTRIWIPYAIAIALLFTATVVYQQPLTFRTGEFFFYKISFVYNLFGPPQLERFRALMPLNGTGNHFWSICLEEQFYLLAPLVIIFLRPLRVPFLIAIWFAGAVFLNLSVDFRRRSYLRSTFL
jgi:peptidoglycan/LPS O-acetylase OafA/YrhL